MSAWCLLATLVVMTVPAAGQSLDIAAESSAARDVAVRVRSRVESLGYAPGVGTRFVEMVRPWPCGRWKARLDDARTAGLGAARIAQAENAVFEELARRIDVAIEQTRGRSEYYHLDSVLADRKSQCLGNCQLLFVLGGAVGLDVRAVEVKVPSVGTLAEHESHVASLLRLADGRVRMIDTRFAMRSRPFVLLDAYRQAGAAWDVADASDPLGVHRRIRPLDAEGIEAAVLMNIGNTYRQAGRHADADAIYRRGLELDPDSPYLHLAVAQGAMGRGDVDAAATLIGRAITIDPGCDDAFAVLGRLLVQVNRPDDAIVALDRAIALKPRSADALELRGRLHEQAGHRDLAVADFRRAAELRSRAATAGQ